MPKKAALYIRVSTVHQIDKDSLPMQRKDLVAYAHFVLGIDDYEVFEDAGYSGKNVERPAYQDMMRRCRDGEFSHILVWKIDRISRNLIDFATMYSELKNLGVVFVSKNEQFDTSSAMGEAMLKIILVFAELERNITRERVTSVMLDRAKNGLWNGTNIPYGYQAGDNQYPVLNPIEAEVVKEIFAKYALLKSLTKLEALLNAKGITAKRGGRWHANTLRQIITNPFYIGTLRYNMKDSTRKRKLKPQDEWVVVKNAHPALIEKDLFDKCQRILSTNSNFIDKTGKHKKVYHTNIFASLIRCSCCGGSLKAQVGKLRKDGMRLATYTCSSRFQYNKPCSNTFCYHDRLVGGFLFNYISNIINAKKAIVNMRSPKELEHFLLNGKEFADVVGIAEIDSLYMSLKTNYGSTYSTNADAADNAEADKIKQEISKKQRALMRLDNLFLYDETAMPEADYIVTKNKLRQEILQLTEQLTQIANASNNIADDVFMSNASNLILLKIFQSGEYIEFEDLVSLVDKPALKEFAMCVVTQITTNNNHILSIEFSNGSIHHFAYK